VSGICTASYSFLNKVSTRLTVCGRCTLIRRCACELHILHASNNNSDCGIASEDDAEQTELGSKARDIKQLSNKLSQNRHLLSSVPTDTLVTLLKCLNCHIQGGRDIEMPKSEEVST